MNTMMKRLTAAAAAVLMLSGTLMACGQTVRSVTHVSTFDAENNPYLYVAYAENQDVSKLKRCTIAADNALNCNEEEKVNALLNADDD